MKTLSFIIMMALALLAFSNAHAQYTLPPMGYGIDIGVARGDNAQGNENFKFTMRGNLQMRILQPLLGQINIGYAQLGADGDYSYNVQDLLIDGRLMLAPIRMDQMFPFLYAGFGLAKDMSKNGSSFLPYIPVGIGIQSKIGPQLMLKGSLGYNLVLSDELDNRVRADSNLNRFTNKKQDGFYEILFGLVYTGPIFAKEQADDEYDY